MKVLKRVVKGLIKQRVEIYEIQYGYMSRCGIADAIFIVRQLQEKHSTANKPHYMTFVDLEKAFDLVPRVALRALCALTLISGAPDVWERHGVLMEEQ